MVKLITIGLKSGRTFSCGMGNDGVVRFKKTVEAAKSDVAHHKRRLMDVSLFVAQKDPDTLLYMDPLEVESIMVEHKSNINVPKKQIVAPGHRAG